MTKPYNGPERRQDGIVTEHRFTILEGIASKNEKGIESLHARFSQFDHEQKAELRVAVKTIIEKLEKKEGDCELCKADIKVLQTHHSWLYGWLTAVTAYFGWDKIK